MAIKVSISKALETKIRDAFESAPLLQAGAAPLLRQLVAVIDDAHDKKKRKAQDGGVSPQAVIKAIRGVLGGKASVPPNPGHAFYGFVKKRCEFLNVSLEDIERVAVHIKLHGRLPTTVEWIIRKLDVHLAELEQAEETGNGGAKAEVELVTGRLGDGVWE